MINKLKPLPGGLQLQIIILYIFIGTIPHISIQCKAPVVGYTCTVKCHVRDFRQPITIFCPLEIPVGNCSPKEDCKSKDGYTIKASYEENVIFLNIPRLNANHSGEWLCTYGGGATSKPEKLQVKGRQNCISSNFYNAVN